MLWYHMHTVMCFYPKIHDVLTLSTMENMARTEGRKTSTFRSSVRWLSSKTFLISLFQKERESYAFQVFILHVPFILFCKVQIFFLLKCNTSGIEPGIKQISAWQHKVHVFKEAD